MISNSGIPRFADYQFGDNAMQLDMLAPAHTGLVWMFQRYLLQKALSVYRWRLPRTWDKDYFLYCLFCFGRLAIVNTDKFGVIPQACGLMGYNVFYRPTQAIITNPLLRGNLTPYIGKECTVIKLQPDYGGIMDLVTYYSNLLGQCAESLGVNIQNSKLAIAFFLDNKALAETAKLMYDQIANGQPAIFSDKNMLNDDGSPRWDVVQSNIKEKFITPELLAVMRRIEQMFDTDIGIPNANTDKRERLITDEVNANNVETFSKCSLWLEQMQESCAQTREMFGIDISVDWRNDPEIGGVE